LVNYVTMVMRANGLPVGIDFTPLWGNRNGGHHWNVLLKEDGRRFGFDAVSGAKKFGDYLPAHYTLAKVYRATYRVQSHRIPANSSQQIPSSLLADNRVDVTDEYIRAFDVDIPLLPDSTGGNRLYATICTF